MKRLAAILPFYLSFFDNAAHGERLREARLVMGTTLDITLCGGAANRQLLNESFEIVDRLEQSFSNYRDDSEVSNLNRKAGKQDVVVSKDLFNMLRLSKDLSSATLGTFDITVGPLMALWEKAEISATLPEHEHIKIAKSHVGSDALLLSEKQSTVMFLKEKMSIDTGGIGKGYAVDQIVLFLKAAGINCGLISFGSSSTYALGAPPDAKFWRLEIKFPSAQEVKIIALKDKALSASDSFGRQYSIVGRQYGRLIDPHSGAAASEKIQAVVLSDSATIAEALSKAIILLPKPELIEKDKVGQFEYLRIGTDGQSNQSANFPIFKRAP